jgi:alpha-amylase
MQAAWLRQATVQVSSLTNVLWLRMFADVDHNHPEVRRDLFYWVTWLASQLRVGGLRLDAVKHYSASFLRDLVQHIDRTVGNDWFIVGEYWRDDSKVLSKFISFMGDRISLFDVRLVNNFSRLSFQDRADLRTVFDGSLVSIRPRHAVVRISAVDYKLGDPKLIRSQTFVANHDTVR